MLHPAQFAVPDWLPLQQLLLVAAALGSLAVARRFMPGDRRWGDVLRRRFVLGVPWGTLLTVLGVLCVYWFLQGGWQHPRRPLTVPFRSWSYFYPLGTLTSGFAHSGVGHITGNLRGTLIYAPLVEYAVGHYPRRRGSQSFALLRTNPFVRVLFVPAGSLIVGLFTALFSLGPVIGFSGVVFAYAGFALVALPLPAVLALVSERVVALVYSGLRFPLVRRQPDSTFSAPWWSDIAIQGHAVGILLGICLAVGLLRRRGRRPAALAVWFAALVFGIRQSLWAVYTPVGSNTYVLFRAVGVALMFVFAALVVSAVAASNRPLVSTERSRLSVLRSRLSEARDRTEPVTPDGAGGGPSRRRVALALLIAALAVVSATAVPFGFATVSGDLPDDAETVEVRDYTVTYVEGAPNQYASVLAEVSLFGLSYDAETVRSSGVVVLSERRRVWIQEVSRGRLAYSGRATVRVGGVDWREEVYVTREGWSLVGNGSTYKVTLRRSGGQPRLAYAAEGVRSEPVVAGRNVSIRPTDPGFEVVVSRGSETLGTAPVPVASNLTTVGGLTFNRTGRQLFAVRNQTRVRVAQKSVPQAQRD